VPSATGPARLAPHSRPPAAAGRAALLGRAALPDRAALPAGRHGTCRVPGRFPQLTAVDRVVGDLRTLL
jgi:hypothetical protein